MNWQHLTYFREVAKTQNFTRSAQELYITPSALSKAISSLEEELGFPLFIKSGRNSVLTEYGKIFQTYVEQAMSCIEEGVNTIHTKINLMSGHLRLSGIYTICSDYLPTQVKGFLALYPNIEISIACSISSKVLDQVLEGKADLGFSADFDPESKKYENIQRQLIGQEERVIVTSNQHPLAAKSHIDFEQLRQEKFILCNDPSTRNRIAFFDACRQYALEPQIAFELADDQSILGMVAANLGISFMADVPSIHRDDIHILHLSDQVPKQNHYMIWRKDGYMSPICQAFRHYILEYGVTL